MIQAIVFDCDGLIIDTETPWYRAMAELYEERGVQLSLEVYSRVLGTSISAFDLYAHLEEVSGQPVDRDETRDRWHRRHKELMREERIRPGVEDYLRQAQELGLRIGLASSSNREWVEKHLRDHGLLDYFEVIRTSNDVERVKPDPALYLSALEFLGVAPEHAVAFEDSPNGTRAAKAAGMYCVTVPNTLTAQLQFDTYDAQISSMAELSLADLLQKLR
ncbi:HAD family hydrolase [Tumebacillus permanentifrigoris]|uniref:HAD superfamily hydrolase (TIGR01509 family)/HAD superfamily hydrolase (TIGR01549 family) n=1 Tax=Tumebacillus permanentifrigoris TaxID=378543 RepID=A0A316D5G7_9BACL|nr:HAD family hydrolase [Tumebacillus permanentifrigoris]PWK08449.1 HAD superfamily hydrolase (TIGR01509 family)/HAD superfamily hydrolase (TIGR01549 family) [Tumebacillus permanentifrigoris]